MTSQGTPGFTSSRPKIKFLDTSWNGKLLLKRVLRRKSEHSEQTMMVNTYRHSLRTMSKLKGFDMNSQ